MLFMNVVAVAHGVTFYSLVYSRCRALSLVGHETLNVLDSCALVWQNNAREDALYFSFRL